MVKTDPNTTVHSSGRVKIYAVLNLLVILLVIIWNYAANALGINGNTVGSLSDTYANLFTPADYAFSIWGVIYAGLIAFGIFGVVRAFSSKDDQFISGVGPWLIITNIANAAWLGLWLTEHIGWSVVAMAVILVALVVTINRLDMERWDAPLPVIAFVWWPISAYSGWIAVASIANVSAWLTTTGWDLWLSEVTWTVIMIIVATLVNLFMIANRHMREFAAVGIWALIAIAVRHGESEPEIQYAAIAGAIILAAAIGLHAYKFRDTLPFIRSSN